MEEFFTSGFLLRTIKKVGTEIFFLKVTKKISLNALENHQGSEELQVSK
jgi:hypothetical protein